MRAAADAVRATRPGVVDRTTGSRPPAVSGKHGRHVA